MVRAPGCIVTDAVADFEVGNVAGPIVGEDSFGGPIDAVGELFVAEDFVKRRHVAGFGLEVDLQVGGAFFELPIERVVQDAGVSIELHVPGTFRQVQVGGRNQHTVVTERCDVHEDALAIVGEEHVGVLADLGLPTVPLVDGAAEDGRLEFDGALQVVVGDRGVGAFGHPAGAQDIAHEHVGVGERLLELAVGGLGGKADAAGEGAITGFADGHLVCFPDRADPGRDLRSG